MTIKFYGTKSHAIRRMGSLANRYGHVVFGVIEGQDKSWAVEAHMNHTVAASVRDELVKGGVALIHETQVNKEPEVTTHETHVETADEPHLAAGIVKQIEAKTAEAAARKVEKARIAAEKKAAAAASKVGVAKAKAEAKAAKAAQAAAEKQAAAPKGEGEPSKWSKQVAKAQAASAEKFVKGEHPFREGSKRRATYDALVRGTTAAAVMAESGWGKSTTLVTFHNIAATVGKTLKREGKGDEAIYTFAD